MDHFGEYIDDSQYEEFEDAYESEREERKMKKSSKSSIVDYDFTKGFNKVVGTKTKKDPYGDITW